jgi:hypothetical protein
VLEFFAKPVRQEKERKRTQIGKEVKLALLTDGMILYLKDPRDFTKKLSDLLNTLGKITIYKIHI